MEKAKKRIRICLFSVVLAAVVIGIIYYFYSVKGQQDLTEGTLIAGIVQGWERLGGHGIW